MDNTGLTGLTGQQRNAISIIAEAEAEGIPVSHLLRTPYSCRWCGFVAGRSGIKRDERKQLLADHEAQCPRAGQPWRFVANVKTFYNAWMKQDAFTQALDAARGELVQGAIRTASTMLQLNTVGAVQELARQITQAEKDSDRRLSAVAILDRADVTTATKTAATGVQVYLPEVDSE